ncbi:MAG TPA: 6,7-dimethyl-8-ribityllumazine synthase, partial [Candidatus Hydrogenedentes bacterium]|nr:6,7-dimethyl-8-ribityllumazine synthase [Candidatus Hydrogenedentota bacterium]
MTHIIEGHFTGSDKRFGIIASRFNEFITNKLVGGALDAFARHGVPEDNITVAWVPGAFEI